MTATIFVDTNVFVYALQTREAAKQPTAAQWLERLWREQSGRTSVQVLSELYVTLTRKIVPAIPRDDARDIMRELFAWNPQPTDVELLTRAHDIERRYRLSWWDSLIVGAAQVQNCAILLTEDLQDHSSYGSLTVRNPFVLGASEELAHYEAVGASIRPHPRRGRPPRSMVIERR